MVGVSVAICTYNGEWFIKKQLKSILHQEHIDELVMVDDNSSDDTVEIAEALLISSGIAYQIVVNDVRLGPAANFEKCISLCSGDIIFFSDQDDIWADNKVKRVLPFFDDQSVSMVFSNAALIDENDNEIDNLHRRLRYMQNGEDTDSYLDELFRFRRSPNGCLMAARKKCIDSIMPFYIPGHFFHDAWLGCALPARGEIRYCKEKLVGYRIHDGSITQSRSTDEEYNTIIKNCTEYEKRFHLTPFDRERAEIIEKVLERVDFKEESRRRLYEDAAFYNKKLIALQEKSACAQILGLLSLYIRGAYRFRVEAFQDNHVNRLNILLRDMAFLVHRK